MFLSRKWYKQQQKQLIISYVLNTWNHDFFFSSTKFLLIAMICIHAFSFLGVFTNFQGNFVLFKITFFFKKNNRNMHWTVFRNWNLLIRFVAFARQLPDHYFQNMFQISLIYFLFTVQFCELTVSFSHAYTTLFSIYQISF